MSRAFPWYKHYPASFIDGVRGMGADQIGCYIVVLDLIYEHGGPIPYHPRVIGGILNASTRKTNNLIQALLKRGKLALRDGQLSNPKADEVIGSRTNESIIAAINGAIGGKKQAENRRRLKQLNDLAQPPAQANLRVRDSLTTSNEYVAKAEEGRRKEAPAPSLADGVPTSPAINGHDAEKNAYTASPALLNSRLMRKVQHA